MMRKIIKKATVMLLVCMIIGGGMAQGQVKDQVVNSVSEIDLPEYD